jgi:hypothetical protein
VDKEGDFGGWRNPSSVRFAADAENRSWQRLCSPDVTGNTCGILFNPALSLAVEDNDKKRERILIGSSPNQASRFAFNHVPNKRLRTVSVIFTFVGESAISSPFVRCMPGNGQRYWGLNLQRLQ